MTRLAVLARLGVCVGVWLGLTACAKDSPASGLAPAEDAAREQGFDAAPVAAEAELKDANEAEAEPAPAEPRSLSDIQRELAVNEAKLRALGVALPGAEAQTATTPDGDQTQVQLGRDVGGAGQPGASPGQPPRDKLAKPKKNTKGKTRDDVDDRPAPDPAKAVQLSPDGQLSAADRCAQICALSDGTCELRGAICELADRHEHEDDYDSACERAGQDCELAEEACRACSE